MIGDETRIAVSYRKFRKILNKNKSELNIEIEQLPENELQILNDFNQHRNWGLHIPESLLRQKREFLKIDEKVIEKYKNNVVVPYYDYFEIKYLEMLNSEVKDVLSGINIIEQRIFKDYSALIGEKFSVEIEQQQVKPYALMKIAEASFNVQRGKST
ncbi:MAG: hypothetical protein Q3M30_15320 [Candidatus Electrothrix sp. Rat3]|nr:hypothetical protein [Candidatus Electrothrix rattekaaiensis]